MSKSYDERRTVKSGSFTFLVDDDDLTAWISGGDTGGNRIYTLPETVCLDGRTYRITSVEIGAFSCEENLEELFIPDCFEYIDEGSFSGCGKLRVVHIGKGLQWYFKWSFSGCPLESVEIDPENPFMKLSSDRCSVLSKDGRVMMYNFLQKKTLVIQEGVEELAECAVSCNNITEEIILPESLRKAGPNAIFECCALKRLVFREGFGEVGRQSLSWNENLLEIDFPSTFRRLGLEAVTDDIRLEKMILRSPFVVDIEVSSRIDIFEGYPTQTCCLLVPAGLVDEYRRHPSWGRFKNIKALIEKN